MKKRGLVWFKNDLRLLDNEALTMAHEECDELIFCYCYEKEWFRILEPGFQNMGAVRFKFLQQSVLELKKNLEEVGGHLLIGTVSATNTIPNLIQEHGITDLYAEEEYASYEISLVKQVVDSSLNVKFHFFWGKTLYHRDDIPFKVSKIPLTSKAYRIPVGREAEPRKSFNRPTKLKSVPGIKSSKNPSYKSYGLSGKDYKSGMPLVKGGEIEGLARLEYYTFKSELLTAYRWSRNKSDGLDYSSKLSPYLALGCVSARVIYERVKAYEDEIKKNQSTWWLVFELVWRDYFTFKAMRFGDSIFKRNGYKNKKLVWENDPKKFEKWCNGTTGIPFVDAHMRQLNQTGFMSNRGRVNCASYMVHDLKIDWRWGAYYFESKLIDYDVSSNWMNWHMQAFEIWYTNPVHQSNKYKAQQFIRKWIPELADSNDIEVLIPWEFEITSYPKPIEVYQKWNRAISLIQK